VSNVVEVLPEPLIEADVPDWMVEEWLWNRPSPEMLRYLELELPLGKPAPWPAFSWESA
jgi:hypothetical protein